MFITATCASYHVFRAESSADNGNRYTLLTTKKEVGKASFFLCFGLLYESVTKKSISAGRRAKLCHPLYYQPTRISKLIQPNILRFVYKQVFVLIHFLISHLIALKIDWKTLPKGRQRQTKRLPNRYPDLTRPAFKSQSVGRIAGFLKAGKYAERVGAGAPLSCCCSRIFSCSGN